MKKIITIMMLVMCLIFVGCSKNEVEPTLADNVEDNQDINEEPQETEVENEKEEPQEEVIEYNHAGQAINPLTGLWVNEEAANRRPIGIMINNYKKAIPQSGISQADIIYETLVEGGIARLFAIFQDFDSEKIGPVRSARHYYLDFAFDHDALYVHYGKSPQAKEAYTRLNAPNLDGLSYLDAIMCFQDPNRKRPHSTYTSYDKLMAAWDTVGYRKEVNDEYESKLKFSEDELNLDSDIIANKVTLPFSYYQTAWFEYDNESTLYKRFQFNKEHIDVETGEQLKFKNIIIQYADMWVIPGDNAGRLDMRLISSGKGYYITNGTAQPITWEKTSHYEPTKYFDETGKILTVNKGKTWIAVFPNDRKDKIIME